MDLIRLIHGDITRIPVDAIVNAASPSLLGGGGVDGAIHRAGGKVILDECMRIRNMQGRCSVGEAVITSSGNLPCKFVIHTVGPVWRGGTENEDTLLTSAYRSSLQLAVANNVQKISFPNISTGVYGFPKEKAARIAIRAVTDFLRFNPAIKEVLFVCFEKENHDLYLPLLSKPVS